jgi:hypothetical protein
MTTSTRVTHRRGSEDPTPTVSSSGVGAANGPERSAPFARWFRYPAGFSSSGLSAALARLGPAAHGVVDPFAGVATCGVAAARRSIPFVGIEAHPQIAELAALKFHTPCRLGTLTEAAARIAEGAVLPPDTTSETELVRRTFPADVLQLLVGLREEVRKSRSAWKPHLKWALLATLRDVASSSVSWPYQRPGRPRVPRYQDPRARLLAHARAMADDLATWEAPPRATLLKGDSRTASIWQSALEANGGQFAGCISSPPYLNNFDYADATRLEMYFWGVASSWSELVSRVRSDMIRGASHQTRIAAAQDARQVLAASNLSAVIALADQLHDERTSRPRGKEYDRLVLCYFADLLDVLCHLRSALRPQASTAWVVGDSAPYGIYVDTPRLILDAASALGFEPAEDVALRSRGRRWRTNGTRHQVDLTERLIVFSTPR